MTLDQLTEALWQAKIALSYRDGVPKATPASRLLALPGVAQALQEHRGAILRCLRSGKGARLEGLVCGTCNELETKETKLELRWCSACEWGTPHYPRRD